MINAEELAICKRRGHNLGELFGLSEHWRRCVSCGMWVRERHVIDEREDDPPEAEIDPLMRMRRGPK